MPVDNRMEQYTEDELDKGIALIGMACKFPGADSPMAFWRNILNKQETISFFSESELIAAGISRQLVKDPCYVAARGILTDVDKFDASFFGYSVYEAQITDPQHRVFLEQAWAGLENAGYVADKFSGAIGLFAGMADSSYLTHNILKNAAFQTDEYQLMLGTSSQFLCTKVAYALGLTGPCVTVNTACSTGLMSISLACESLIAYNCDMALAGGITIIVPQQMGYLYQESGIESPDGHCRAFDAQAKGMVTSNGCGIVVLKRLADAVKDNDSIVAVIRGWAINNDGSDKVGFTAPSVSGQMACISQAIAFAGIEPTEMDYIEAHGTGTLLGDPIEVTALSEAYQYQAHQQAQYCALGSVKTNIGHTDVAAGVAGFIKTAMAIKEKCLPPNLHFVKGNEKINFPDTPFYVNSEVQPWERKAHRRTAAVNSMGIGGTNAHVIMQEPIPTESSASKSANVFILSAKTQQALDVATDNLKQIIATSKIELKWADAAYTLQLGRKYFKWRRVIPYTVEGDLSVLVENTHELANDQITRVIFGFPGQGSQYVNMAREIYEEQPFFKGIVDSCCEILKQHLKMDLRDILFSNALEPELANEQLRQTLCAQPALFVIEYALAMLLVELGIKPDAMIGHSIGEYVAATVSGVLRLDDALLCIAVRAQLMSETLDGTMLIVPLSQAILQPLLPDNISLAADNAPELCVISGERTAILAFEQMLKHQFDLNCLPLQTSYAFHSSLMDSMLDEFSKVVIQIPTSKPNIPYLSNLTGDWISEVSPHYWIQQLRSTVQFSASIKKLQLSSNDIFIEVGPSRTLTQLLKQHQKNQPASTTLSILPHPKEQISSYLCLMQAVGKLWLYGKEINWPLLYVNESRKRVPLPSYPFERKRYWIDPSPLNSDFQNTEEGLYSPVWERTFPLPFATSKDASTWLVFGEVPAVQSWGQKIVTVINGDDFSMLDENRFIICVDKKEHYLKLLKQMTHTVDTLTVIHAGLLSQEVDTAVVLQKGPFSLLYLSQAFTELFPEKKMHALVLATNLYQVLGHETVYPAKATIAGPCKVIPQEHENIALKLIELESATISPMLSAQLFSEALQITHEDFAATIAYRGDCRWIRHYKPCSDYLDKSPIESRLKQHGVYLITGGLGGIGLCFAQFLAKDYQANLILTSRSASELSPEQIRVLNDIRSSAMSLSIQQAAVEDEMQMLDVIETIKSKFGRIDGLIHAAGVPGGGVAQFKTVEEYLRILQPKLYGTQNLFQLLRNESLDFVVLISSLTALTGFPGQIDYCSANLALDAFAASNQLKQSVFCVSMNWQAWREVGMAAKSTSKLMMLDASNSTSVTDAVLILKKTLSSLLQQIIISGHNPNNPQINQDLMQHSTSDILIQQEGHRKNYDQLTQVLIALWQQVLGVEQLDIDEDFYELGGHSLLAISLLTKLSNKLGKRISPSILFKARTVRALAEALQEDRPVKHDFPLVTLQQGEGKSPMFLLHPIGGTVFCYLPFVRHLKRDRMFYGIQDPSIEQEEQLFSSFEDMATAYRKAIQAIQPQGPYYLCGASFGANLVMEVAFQLLQDNQQIHFAGLLDGWPIYSSMQHDPNYLQTLIHRHEEDGDSSLLPQETNNRVFWEKMLKHRTALMLAYQVKKIPVKLTLYKSTQILLEYEEINSYDNHWSAYSTLPIEVVLVPGDHHSMLEEPHAITLAQCIQRSLDE